MKKKLRLLVYFVCMAVILTIPAFAYVDPSVTTFAIQGIVAVVVVAGAVVGVVWRKMKKKAMQVLNIDENAGKVVEDDLVVFTDEEKAAEAVAAETAPVEETPAQEETVQE